jgi:DNA-binding MarR family transcriptional regulator
MNQRLLWCLMSTQFDSLTIRLVLGRPPAEADLRRHFRVTPPSVHQMLITLEREGLIRRQPGIARSIQLLIDPGALPPLLPSQHQSVKTAVHGY